MKSLGILIISIIIVLAVVFLVAVSNLADSMGPTYSQVELVYEKSNSKLYLKSKNWGVTGDSQLTVISTDNEPEFEADSTADIIFHGLSPFLYQVRKDSLILFVRKKAEIPNGFKTNWTIIQNEINNPEMMEYRTSPAYRRM
ncbi:hypothetical protein [Rufibacter immobilis]|nr:hypothetical protein [Rufibacter immobilis]